MYRYSGIVDKIKFQDADTSYTIFELETDNGSVTVKGYFPVISEGFCLTIQGEMYEDPQHGRYLAPKKWMANFPVRKYEVINYLSDLVYGDFINPNDDSDDELDDDSDEPYDYPFSPPDPMDDVRFYIREMYDRYERNLYDMILDCDNRLREVNPKLAFGAPYSKLLIQLNSALEQEKKKLDFALELADIDPMLPRFFWYLVNKIDAMDPYYYSPTFADALRDDPYQFCEGVDDGYTFLNADCIAKYYGLPMDSLERCMAGLPYAFYRHILSEGHVFATYDQLIEAARKVLELDDAVLNRKIDTLERIGILVHDTFITDSYYLAEFYDMEKMIAEKLRMIGSDKGNTEIAPDFNTIDEYLGVHLDEYQKEAITKAVNSPVAIITGGPGTGKTSIIKGIVAAFKSYGYNSIKLAAPTGRAALRMKDATGVEAQTIHRLLGINPKSTRDDVQEIAADVVIIDESSMIDISLMDKLLYAITPPTKLILVGDVNQLPSVGPGYVLHDIIASEMFETIKLVQTYRQAQNSLIVKNAKHVLNGEDIEFGIGADFHFIPAEDRNEALTRILEIYQNATEETMILSAVKEGEAGIKHLNKKVQATVQKNTDISFRTVENELFYSGDPVMVTRNDYDRDVFNGEISISSMILDHDYRKILGLRFDDERLVIYQEGKLETKWLTLAYAITVHKSQGGEYPIVIMPVFKNRNLYRNLIYTAMTRAKEHLYFIGSSEALREGIADDRPVKRNGKLKERIQLQ